MKKILLSILFVVIFVAGTVAQKLTYQAVIRNQNQQLVPSTSVIANVVVKVKSNSVYTETVNGNTNIHGLLEFQFGDDSFASIDWPNATISVQVKNAATQEVYVPIEDRPVTAVPYALYAVSQGTFVQANWSETDNNSDAYIRNKPSIKDTVSTILSDKDFVTTIVMNDRIKDTLSKYTPTDQLCNVVNTCDLSSNPALSELLNRMNAKFDAQNAKMDSLSRLLDAHDSTIKALNEQVKYMSFVCGKTKVKDADGNEYNTVALGDQCWLKENLRTKVDGDYGYPKDSDGQVIIDSLRYGRLYSWTVLMNGENSSNEVPSSVRGICPKGWHVPSDAEWNALTYYVYTSSDSSYRCRNCGSHGWLVNTPCIAKALADSVGWNTNAIDLCAPGKNQSTNNATGFSALPAGHYAGGSNNLGINVRFWSASRSEGNDQKAQSWKLSNGSADVFREDSLKNEGMSVRCLRNVVDYNE